MSIFISIASYQDPLLVSTIFSAYNNAEKKEDLVFSICDQSDHGIKVDEIAFANQIHYEHVDPLFSKGPCWARHRAQNFFNDEEFLICKKAYLFYFSLQQVLNITVKGQIEGKSVQNIKNMLKLHDFEDLPDNIDTALHNFSKSRLKKKKKLTHREKSGVRGECRNPVRT